MVHQDQSPVSRTLQIARSPRRDLAPAPTTAIVLWRLLRSPLVRRVVSSPITLGLVAALVGPRLARLAARQALAPSPLKMLARQPHPSDLPFLRVRHLVRQQGEMLEVGTEVTAHWPGQSR